MDRFIIARPLLALGIRQKMHLGFEITVWENSLISTIPSKPAQPSVLVVHLRIMVSNFICGEPNEWDMEMLDRLVLLEGI